MNVSNLAWEELVEKYLTFDCRLIINLSKVIDLFWNSREINMRLQVSFS